MSDPYNRTSKGPHLFLPAVGIIGALAVLGAAGFAAYGFHNSPAEVEKRADAEMARDKPMGPVLLKLKTDFPDDYDALDFQLDELTKVYASTDRKAALVYRYIRRMGDEYDTDLAVAPAQTLKAMANGELVLATALQAESPDNCDAAFLAMASPGESFRPATLQAMMLSSEATLTAILAGRKAPTAPRGAVTEAEQAVFHETLRLEGLTPQLEGFLTRRDLHTASPQERCRIGLAVLRSGAKLPSPLAEKLYSGELTLTKEE